MHFRENLCTLLFKFVFALVETPLFSLGVYLLKDRIGTAEALKPAA